jgi:hypothetical protein
LSNEARSSEDGVMSATTPVTNGTIDQLIGGDLAGLIGAYIAQPFGWPVATGARLAAMHVPARSVVISAAAIREIMAFRLCDRVMERGTGICSLLA